MMNVINDQYSDSNGLEGFEVICVNILKEGRHGICLLQVVALYLLFFLWWAKQLLQTAAAFFRYSGLSW
jgi:hypothetical protein